MPHSYQIGIGKSDITAFFKGVGMLGYGMHFNTMEGVATPLFARAFCISESNAKLNIVVCELCFITIALKRGVIKKLQRKFPALGVTDENLMLLAQHTHSGPGGFDHHAFYNTSIPGFCHPVYSKLVDGIVEAIVSANSKLQKGYISYGNKTIPEDVPVAFNRSLAAYNNNKDVKKLTASDRHLAVDRNMYLMNFIAESGKPLGSINWFGVHTTSISNDNNLVNADNKGYASEFLEAAFDDAYVGAFAQGVCGDVSPKFNFNSQHPYQRGKWDGTSTDDIASAQDNGEFQFNNAIKIIDERNADLSGSLDAKLSYFDAAAVNVDPEFCDDLAGQKTGPACFGVSFFEGALTDGPGMHPILGWQARRVAEFFQLYERVTQGIRQEELLDKFGVQGNKHIVIEAGRNRILFTKNVKGIIVPAFADELIKTLKKFHRSGSLDNKPWVNQILPLQIFRIGSLAIVGIPAEVTVVSGRRFTASLEKAFAGQGIEQIILAPYANTYAGYITTYEEYQEQMYEGGHTLFGKWTLAAFQTQLKKMVSNWSDKDDSIQPILFADDEIEKRAFYIRKYYTRREAKRTSVESA